MDEYKVLTIQKNYVINGSIEVDFVYDFVYEVMAHPSLLLSNTLRRR